MIVVFIVVLVVFGPQKLPELARSLGKLMAEFRKASLDFKTAFEEEMRDLERQALVAERKKAADAAAASAAAQPAQSATSAPPTGTETPANAISGDGQGSEAPPSQTPAEAPATEPVVSPAAEAVARSEGASTESKTEVAAASNVQDAVHDASLPPA